MLLASVPTSRSFVTGALSERAKRHQKKIRVERPPWRWREYNPPYRNRSSWAGSREQLGVTDIVSVCLSVCLSVSVSLCLSADTTDRLPIHVVYVLPKPCFSIHVLREPECASALRWG
jgi:hypothetical protein